MSFRRDVLATTVLLTAALLLSGCSNGGADSARTSAVTVRGTVVSAESSEPLAEGRVAIVPIVGQSSDATAAPWDRFHLLELTDEWASWGALTITDEGELGGPYGITDTTGTFEYSVPYQALQQHTDWAVYVQSQKMVPRARVSGFASRSPDTGPLIIKLTPKELSDSLVDLGQLKVTLR